MKKGDKVRVVSKIYVGRWVFPGETGIMLGDPRFGKTIPVRMDKGSSDTVYFVDVEIEVVT